VTSREKFPNRITISLIVTCRWRVAARYSKGEDEIERGEQSSISASIE
jgi:hypothetical protein